MERPRHRQYKDWKIDWIGPCDRIASAHRPSELYPRNVCPLPAETARLLSGHKRVAAAPIVLGKPIAGCNAPCRRFLDNGAEPRPIARRDRPGPDGFRM